MKKFTFKPKHDRILIKPAPPDQYRAGLDMGSEAEAKAEGTVIAIGDGVPLHEVQLKISGETNSQAIEAIKDVIKLIENGRKIKYSPGEQVLYGKYAGTKIYLNEEEHIIVREADVFGTLEEITEPDHSDIAPEPTSE